MQREQIASVYDLRIQRAKRYFILMPGLLRYFRLRPRSSRWSTKFDFLVAFDILAARTIRPHFSRFTTNSPPLRLRITALKKKRKKKRTCTEPHSKRTTKCISIKFHLACLTLRHVRPREHSLILSSFS